MDKTKIRFEENTAAGRREFFKHVLSDTICFFEELSGRPQMRLSRLDLLPDEIVRGMVPVLNRKRSFTIKGLSIMRADSKSGKQETIYEMDDVEQRIIRCFDGSLTIEEISRIIENQCDIDRETADKRVRSFFLALAKHMICCPAHAHDSHAGP